MTEPPRGSEPQLSLRFRLEAASRRLPIAAIGDGALTDFSGLRARLARVPIRDATHPAAESLKPVRDGTLTFLGRDWAADALADPGFWFHDPVTGRRWAGSERSAFQVDVRS